MPTISPFVSGFSHTPPAHSISSINAQISTDQIAKGKPKTIAQTADSQHARASAAESVAVETVQRHAVPASTEHPTTSQPHPQTTSYNAQGQVHAIEVAQTGQRFHATV